MVDIDNHGTKFNSFWEAVIVKLPFESLVVDCSCWWCPRWPLTRIRRNQNQRDSSRAELRDSWQLLSFQLPSYLLALRSSRRASLRNIFIMISTLLNRDPLRRVTPAALAQLDIRLDNVSVSIRSIPQLNYHVERTHNPL